MAEEILNKPWSAKRTAGSILALAVAIFLGLVLRNGAFFFREGSAESSDLAANALQIRRAKHGTEIYGNYSRFRFHHPGPAFWYCYAGAEMVLYDGLKLVPSPANAHLLAGAFLQSFCWAAALVLVARGLGCTPGIGLGLLIGLAHFGAANSHWPGAAFLSIWPPHVLLMPFVLFLVLSAGAAAGWRWSFPGMVAAGALLVHGHVAQPLFVVPIFALAGGCWLRHWWPGRHPGGRAPLLAAAGILGLAMWPLVLDWTRTPPRNIDLIFAHVGHHPEVWSWGDAIAYVCSFFGYRADQDQLITHWASGWGSLWTAGKWPVLAGLGLLGLQLTYALLGWSARARETSGHLVFQRWLVSFILGAYVLSVVWARHQTGGLYQFNSFFEFGLTYLSLWTTATIIWRNFSLPGFGPVGLVVLGAGLIALLSGRGWAGEPATTPIRYNEIVARNTDHTKRHFLLFDQRDISLGTQLALALDRQGEAFEVSPVYGFMFGRDQAGYPAPGPDRDFLLVSRDRIPGGFAVPGGRILAEATPPAFHFGGPGLAFGVGGNARPYLHRGFSMDEAGFVWAEEPEAWLIFSRDRADRDVRLTLDVIPHVGPGHEQQRVEIRVGKRVVGRLAIGAPGRQSVLIPREVWNENPVIMLGFGLPDLFARPPQSAQDDPRTLAVAFSNLRVDQDPAGGAAAAVPKN